MSEKNNISLFVKSFNKQISDDEKNLLNNILTDENSKRDFDEFGKVWEDSGKYQESFNVDVADAFQKFSAKYDLSGDTIESSVAEPKVATQETKTVRLKPNFLFLKVAAAIALLVVGWVSFSTTGNGGVISNDSNDMVSVVLEDKSTIYLAPNSQITKSKGFGRDNRELSVDGKVYFDISKNKKLPFNINTNSDLKITVVGTEFSVNTRHADYISVDVKEGKVKLATSDKEFMLDANESAAYIVANKEIKQIDQSLNALSWKDNKLSFDGTPIKQVIAELEDYYVVDIDVVEANANCHFTAKDIKSPTLDQMLELLKVSFDIKVSTLSDSKYEISNINCK